MAETHQGRTGDSACWATALSWERSCGRSNMVQTKAARIAMTTSGVIPEMMLETRSTSS